MPGVEEDAPILPMNQAGTQPRSPVACLILDPGVSTPAERFDSDDVSSRV